MKANMGQVFREIRLRLSLDFDETLGLLAGVSLNLWAACCGQTTGVRVYCHPETVSELFALKYQTCAMFDRRDHKPLHQFLHCRRVEFLIGLVSKKSKQRV